MLNRKKWKLAIQKEQKKSTLLTWIEKQLQKIGYDLSDNYCKFYIRNRIEQKGQSIIIELYLLPLVGIFQSIEFKPKIFIKNHNFTVRPHIYNDRRLFHPNINMLTCQLVFPQLVRQWNPTQQFSIIFQNLKYTIIEPNLKFVPNTEYNKKSAWNYYFNKKNYRNLIIQNSPLYLEHIIGQQFNYQNQNKMEVQESSNSQRQSYQQFFWSIDSIVIRKTKNENNDSILYDEKEILMLTKQIKSLTVHDHQQLIQF